MKKFNGIGFHLGLRSDEEVNAWCKKNWPSSHGPRESKEFHEARLLRLGSK